MAVSRIGDTGSAVSFSPTDLVAAAPGACSLNVLGAYAETHVPDITGTTAEIVKKTEPNLGPIASITVVFNMPQRNYIEREKKALQNCVKSCPVHGSLDAKVEQKLILNWQEGGNNEG